MNVTNPKVSIFFLAFLPQFINPEEGILAAQFFVLGAIFILIALVIFIGIASLAGLIGDWFTLSDKNQKTLNRIAGTVFICLAAKLFVSSAGA